MIKFDQFVQVIHDAALSANQAVSDENVKIINKYFENHDGTLKPKTLNMQYPQHTDKGVVMKNVKIPVITLIPVSLSEISEVKFKTDIEVFVEDDDLKVSFPHKNADSGTTTATQESPSHTSTLEITVHPTQVSAGLKHLIQGYEKVLRGQLPH